MTAKDKIPNPFMEYGDHPSTPIMSPTTQSKTTPIPTLRLTPSVPQKSADLPATPDYTGTGARFEDDALRAVGASLFDDPAPLFLQQATQDLRDIVDFGVPEVRPPLR